MNKLTMHLRTILIGLSILEVTSGCGLLTWDEPDYKLSLVFENESLNTILLKFV